MKSLRFLSLGVLSAIVLFVGLGLLLPKKYTVSKKVEISAEPLTVFTLINNLNYWEEWAFEEVTLKPSTESDNVYTWEDSAGTGEISIVNSRVPNFVKVTVSTGDKAFESESNFEITEKSSGITEVVWTDTQNLNYNFIARYYAFFADYEKKVSKTYTYGLQKLKDAAEKRNEQLSNDNGLNYALQDSTVAIWQSPNSIIEKMQPLRGKVVAEIAARGGFLSRKMAAQAKKVISLQTEKVHLSLAEKFSSPQTNNVEVRLTGVISPAIYEAETDIVLCSYAYSLFKDPITYFKRIRRGLKPNGRIYLLEFTDNIPKGFPAQLSPALSTIKNVLSKADFEKITHQKIGNNQILVSGVTP